MRDDCQSWFFASSVESTSFIVGGLCCAPCIRGRYTGPDRWSSFLVSSDVSVSSIFGRQWLQTVRRREGR